MNRLFVFIMTALLLAYCTGRDQRSKITQTKNTMITDSTKLFGYNLNFLKKYVGVAELKKGKASVVVVPAWQGRVMTSTSEGPSGFSFGWINHQLVSSRKILPHINPFGGEERLWLGPEGGQYAIFFKKGDEFVYDKWQTPAFLDTEPFSVIARTDTSIVFSHEAEIENYSGTSFKLRIDREVKLLSGNEFLKSTGIDLEGTNYVVYTSQNKLTNLGKAAWKKETGLLSIWMLGMFNPSPAVIIVIPVKQGDEKALGVQVNDNYFGKISDDRLKIIGNNIYFRADGKSRGKIGIPPLRATGVMGSYDFDNNILTLLICKLPEGEKNYVNSAWQIQDNPYSGDALNSYNDGPLADGSQMGPFYELETSSPAAALKPGESITHSQITVHITGNRELLDKVSMKVFGVTLHDIQKTFN
jgi:Family of unknown function (DUF6786)